MRMISRRRFLASTVALLATGKPAQEALATSAPCDPATLLPGGAFPEEEFRGADDDCPACGGWGKLLCPACDGTLMWTEASESAGLYQREAARRLGRCAWCDEWGEIICPECEGIDERIAEAQMESSRTCEVCGQPSVQLETGRWIRAKCDSHAHTPEEQ